ncbi:MAG TPA: hypothetical protein VIY86_00005, partial [Pirellulaceae bacterium]
RTDSSRLPEALSWKHCPGSTALEALSWNASRVTIFLQALVAIDTESNGRGTSELKRIVSLLTWLIQRTDPVPEGVIE